MNLLVTNKKNQDLLDALTRPPVFKKFLQKYDRKDFPKQEIIQKVLKSEFAIPDHRLELCANIIIANVNNFNLIHQKTNILRLAQLSSSTMKPPTEVVESEDTDSDDTDEVNLEAIPKKPQNESTEIIPKVFISHSKNENILKQLKTILKFGRYEYVIAKDIETTAISIPEKIFEFMKKCNCAIIIVSADEEMKQEEGNYRINENVLIEIGGAFIRYDKRVILLVDTRLTLPSNLQGLYRCEYEGDELSWTVGMKLQEALTNFRKLL